jgi:purine nucleoside phosphorylase
MGRKLAPPESRSFFKNTKPSTKTQSVASLRKQSQARPTAKSVNIAMIGGAGFYHIAKTKKHKIFITSLSEIEYALKTRQHPAEKTELKEIQQQLP